MGLFWDAKMKRLRHRAGIQRPLDASDAEHLLCCLSVLTQNTTPQYNSSDRRPKVHTARSHPIRHPDPAKAAADTEALGHFAGLFQDIESTYYKLLEDEIIGELPDFLVRKVADKSQSPTSDDESPESSAQANAQGAKRGGARGRRGKGKANGKTQGRTAAKRKRRGNRPTDSSDDEYVGSDVAAKEKRRKKGVNGTALEGTRRSSRNPNPAQKIDYALDGSESEPDECCVEMQPAAKKKNAKNNNKAKKKNEVTKKAQRTKESTSKRTTKRKNKAKATVTRELAKKKKARSPTRTNEFQGRWSSRLRRSAGQPPAAMAAQ